MATTTDQNALLERVIDNSDDITLRMVLKSMCQGSEECRKEAIQRMLTSRKRDVIELSDTSDDDAQKASKKQKKSEDTPIARFERCKKCEKTYDVTLNDDTACMTHPGMLDIDPEVFPDDDDVQYGIGPDIDVYTDWRREEWPEGFIWSCCDEDCNSKGCQVQRHTPEDHY
ncbi:hypothetical protein F4808DRAFT_35293 [Astrocystis sublimbata]|nr:hypothetical protein F4808DRAFT_95622 [Astrocystis sublimbata]KAI0203217.1 hypothetical protein F4808DRAFT_35293 [Astrocystis sublimbata]